MISGSRETRSTRGTRRQTSNWNEMRATDSISIAQELETSQ